MIFIIDFSVPVLASLFSFVFGSTSVFESEFDSIFIVFDSLRLSRLRSFLLLVRCSVLFLV